MIQTTAIVGMGALGLLYADVIVKARGNDGAAFVLDEERLVKYEGMTFTINGENKSFKMISNKEAKLVDLYSGTGDGCHEV